MTKKEKLFNYLKNEVEKLDMGNDGFESDYFQILSLKDSIEQFSIAGFFFQLGAIAQATKNGNNAVVIGKIFSYCKENFKSIL